MPSARTLGLILMLALASAGGGTPSRGQTASGDGRAQRNPASSGDSASESPGFETQSAAPQLAITFDDLPAHGPLPPGEPRRAVMTSILATLKAEHVPPVYGFINGFRVAQFPYQIELLQAWRDAGEPLGNHTWSHPELDKSTVRSYTRDIARNEPMLGKLAAPAAKAATDTGSESSAAWHWFRYPFLEEGDTLPKREAVRAWLAAHQYRIAQVSMDFQDYQWNDVYARCRARGDDAAIPALEDTYLDAAAKAATAFRELSHSLYGRDVRYILLMHLGAFDARMLPRLIAQFRSEGFAFTTLPEAAADPIYDEDPQQTTKGGATFLEQIAAARKVHVPELPDVSAQLDRLCR